MGKGIITVTSPLLPDLEELKGMMQDIWERRWITNMGEYHQRFEQALAEYLGVEYISVFTNGTLPLITALQALGLRRGEVITTPYSFVATTHSIWWNGLKPVFVDVEETTGNIDVSQIESAITEETVAIMPVHVYGQPCDVEGIDSIAKKHNLKVIYDAAHAFGVKYKGESVLKWGDMSTLSFHATKVFNTVEGGALVCHNQEMKQQVDYLKNFGFEDEVTVVAPGINSKMDEVRSAYGLLNLRQVDAAISVRKSVALRYRQALRGVKGISCLQDMPNVKHNYSYFPIFVDADQYGMTRDELYEKMKTENVYGRRYFYPLITEFSPYREFSSANEDRLSNAKKKASQVICLPMHHALSDEDVDRVINCIIDK